MDNLIALVKHKKKKVTNFKLNLNAPQPSRFLQEESPKKVKNIFRNKVVREYHPFNNQVKTMSFRDVSISPVSSLKKGIFSPRMKKENFTSNLFSFTKEDSEVEGEQKKYSSKLSVQRLVRTQNIKLK